MGADPAAGKPSRNADRPDCSLPWLHASLAAGAWCSGMPGMLLLFASPWGLQNPLSGAFCVQDNASM